MGLDSAASFSFWKRSLPQRELQRETPPPLYQIPGQGCQAALRILFAPGLWVGLGAGKDGPWLPRDSQPATLGESYCSAQTQRAFLQGAGPLEA